MVAGAAVLVAVALIASARDEATTDAPVQLPGVPGRPPTGALQALTERGNVVVLHPPGARDQLRALVRDVTGVPAGEQASLLRVGQGIELVGDADRVVAYGGSHTLEPAGAADPALRRFAEFWLGRAAKG